MAVSIRGVADNRRSQVVGCGPAQSFIITIKARAILDRNYPLPLTQPTDSDVMKIVFAEQILNLDGWKRFLAKRNLGH